MRNNISQMEGTSWHVGYIKMSENDTKRHKSRCKYYNKEECDYYNYKCPGSSHCSQYRELVKKPGIKRVDEQIKLPMSNIVLHGKFVVKYLEDNEIIEYEIGKNIGINAPLVKKIYNYNINSVFELNGSKIKLIKKELYEKKN